MLFWTQEFTAVEKDYLLWPFIFGFSRIIPKRKEKTKKGRIVEEGYLFNYDVWNMFILCI